MQFQPPHMATQPRPSRLGWFRNWHPLLKIGCGIVMIPLALVVCSAVVVGAWEGFTRQIPSTPTAQVVQHTQIADVPTHQSQPTQVPTLLPSPTATKQPTVIPTTRPTQPPTPAPKPTQPTCQAVNNNPWCYNFTPGNLIYNPPSNFCDYFNCIPSFWQSTNGYVDECNDGTYSHSGGRSGACSHHGGEMRPLYSH